MGTIATPRTWHWTVTAVPRAATSHHHGRCVRHACQAPARATALDSAIRLGFQMNVEPSTAEVDMASSRPATRPATGPAIDRASHQVTATAAIPASAMTDTTASGESPPVRKAAGARR